MPKRSIPNYELYGELLAGNYTDVVHHETIQERSRRHDWTIRLHRHSRLAQVFVFRSAGVSVRLADLEHTSSGPMILLIPPGVPHGFRFAKDVAGDVLSVRTDKMSGEVRERLDHPSMRAGAMMTQGKAQHFEAVMALMVQLRGVYHSMETGRLPLLDALTDLVLTYLWAEMQRDSLVGHLGASFQQTGHEALADRFCALVEEHYAAGWAVADFADRTGVSAPHLTRVCGRVLGASPNELVRQRRLLEAKRLLEYTHLSISEIAHRSGFRDPAFFSRSFRGATGLSPKSYRIENER